jgi:flagellar basal-body rod protein FlgC
MGINKVSSPIDIAITGMRAESQRMSVISNNIANSNTTRTDSGEPYRRRDVLLSTSSDAIDGVSSMDIFEDTSTPFKQVYDSGNPDANAEGYVDMPNVELPKEMMSMVLASRAYQANAAVLKRHGDMQEVTMELLK